MQLLNEKRFGFQQVGIVSVLMTMLLIVGCSSDESGDLDVPSAEDSLANSRVAMAEVPQFEFELTHPEGKTSLDGGLELRRADGAVISPSRLKVNAEADFEQFFVRVNAVVIDGETWMTNPLTGNWAVIAPEDSPFSFLDPVRLVTNVLAQTTDPVYPDAGATSNGQIVLNGKVPSEALQPLVGTVLPGELLDVTLRLDPETFLLSSARLNGRLQPEDQSDFVRLIELSGFDSELVIEPPI